MALPTDSNPIVFEKFGSLNTQVNRAAIPDNDFSWIENFMPIKEGDLRTLYAEGPTLYSSPNIIYEYPYNIGPVSYHAVFFKDGTANQVATDGSVTPIGSGFYTVGGPLPAAAQWESKYLLIISTNGYWVWDGSDLFTAGGIGPNVTITDGGSNYTSPPTITAVGGSGSGATFSSTIVNGSVATVIVTNPGSGYVDGDQPILVFSGGGSDSTATASAVISTNSGGVSSITITDGGTAYTDASVVSFTGGGGTGAQAVITGAVGGTLTEITVVNPGSGYTSPPTVHVSVGSGATFLAQITRGQISAINVTDPGSGFTANPTVVISGDGTGATATTNLVGGISSVQVTAGGSAYATAPTVSFSGGGGSGAAATAVITGGVVTAVNVTSPGTGYTSAPAVAFASGTGSGAAATATNAFVIGSITVTNPGLGYTKATVVLVGGNNAASATVSLMPFGVAGTTIETYQDRVWLANITTAQFTGPGSVTDFSTSGGGGSYPATDNFLRRTISCFKQVNGFLYQFGDSSINVISNVQTSGVPATTSFNNSNIDAQVGTNWRDSVVAFGRALVFANPSGVYALYGGAAEKISDQLDGLFETADFTVLTPTAAVMTIFNIRVYMFLFRTTNKFDGETRNLLAMWDGKKWFIGSQLKTPVFVSTQEIDSIIQAWGNDGTNLYPMFTTPSAALGKVYQSKLMTSTAYIYAASLNNVYLVSHNNQAGTVNLSVGLDTDHGQGPFNVRQSTGFTIDQYAPKVYSQSVYGRLLGMTATTNAADLTMISHTFLTVPDYAAKV